MRGAAVQFVVALVLVMMLGGNRAIAQPPPNEPNDFSAAFVGIDYLASRHPIIQRAVARHGVGFKNFGFWFPGIPSTVTGSLFEDFTNKRERFDVGTTDPRDSKPLVAIWKFYDKGLMYFYRYSTGQCTKSSLPSSTIQPFFLDLAHSSFQGQTGFAETVWFAGSLYSALPGNIWTYPLSAGNTVEFGTGTSSSQTPLYITRYTPGRITRLQFTLFTSGQPDASVFNLPAACTAP